MKYKRILIAFVISLILLTNFNFCFGADDDLLLPIFVANCVNETNIRMSNLEESFIDLIEI